MYPDQFDISEHFFVLVPKTGYFDQNFLWLLTLFGAN
jgi:hypothetical protein